MSNTESLAEAIAEMAQSIHATPNNRRRLKSGTFWGRLGCRRRTPGVIEEVRRLLEHHCVSVSLRKRGTMEELPSYAFGSEDKADWLVLSCEAPAQQQAVSPEVGTEAQSVPRPLDKWFHDMAQLTFRSEADVVNKFIRPLFEQLGFEEPDFAFEYPVEMHFGQEVKSKEVDVVLFKRTDHIHDVLNPENILILVEAKKLRKPIDADVVGQARSYAMWLAPVYYVVTNGDDIAVYLYRMTVAKDEPAIISLNRSNLNEKWPELFKLLSKGRVLEAKEQRQQIISELQKLCSPSS